MAISTGGLSVPQLGQTIDTSSYGQTNVPKIEVPKGMSLSDLINVSRGSLALQKEKATLEPEIAATKAQSERIQVEAKKAGIDLGQHTANIARGLYGGYLTDPDFVNGNKKEMIKKLKEAKSFLTSQGLTPPDEGKGHEDLISLTEKDPKAAYQTIKNGVLVANGPQSQLAQTTPQYTTNAAGQIVGLTTGTNQISAPNEAPQGQPQIAPQGQPQGGAPSQIQGQFTQRQLLNPTRATAEMGNVAATNLSADFTATQQAASGAEPRIALFQNIKKLAPEAFTGVGGQRKELAAGIAQAVGMDIFTTEKMSTDELAKTSAMLSLAGGNTDMARQLAEAANPNKKMNEQAIKQIADQMIGMEKLNQAKYKFLQPVANDPAAYADRLQKFNQVNDFHIFQETTPEEVAKLKRSMSPDQQRAMGEKIKLARQLGLI
jgi:hypothetical protein